MINNCFCVFVWKREMQCIILNGIEQLNLCPSIELIVSSHLQPKLDCTDAWQHRAFVDSASDRPDNVAIVNNFFPLSSSTLEFSLQVSTQRARIYNNRIAEAKITTSQPCNIVAIYEKKIYEIEMKLLVDKLQTVAVVAFDDNRLCDFHNKFSDSLWMSNGWNIRPL